MTGHAATALFVALAAAGCNKPDELTPAPPAPAPVADMPPPPTSPGQVGGLAEYRMKSMTVEAVAGVRSISTMLQYVLETEGAKLPASRPATPAIGACCKSPEKTCGADVADWSAWDAIGFRPAAPHRYSYELTTTDTGFTVRAIGDLDCDGTYSTFEQVGTLVYGKMTLAADLKRIDELE